MGSDGLPAEVTIDDGVDVDSIGEKRVDDSFLHHAILGRDLTEMFTNKRLQLAADRHFINQRSRLDMSEMFSPERVTAVCRDMDWNPDSRWISKMVTIWIWPPIDKEHGNQC